MRLLSRDEIAAGIRNALERGSSLEEAVQSFINAGYNPNEVEEAASVFSASGLSMASSGEKPRATPFNIIQSNEQQVPEDISSAALNKPIPQIQKPIAMSSISSIYQNIPQKKKSNIFLIIFLIILLLIVIGAIIAAVMYKDQLAEFLSSLFGSG